MLQRWKASKFDVFLNIIVVSCMLLILGFILLLYRKGPDDFIFEEKRQLGVELVNAMYSFESAYELDSNMSVVKELVTEPVFNDLSIDNEQRTLTTYFRFKGCSCKVNIINSTDCYVMYSLDSVVMEPERKFILMFRINEQGLIDWVKEAELIEFRDTIY